METTLSDWIVDGLKIFTLVFLIGKLINRVFAKVQERFKISRSIAFGFVHLMFFFDIFLYFARVYIRQV